MGLISFLGEWGAAAGKVTKSDKTIHFLTGINPKHLHPELYRNNATFPPQVAQQIGVDGSELTIDEFSALRLAMLLVVYDKHEEYKTAQKYADALGRLLRTRRSDIRDRVIHIISSDICYGVKTIDSNPSGEPYSHTEKPAQIQPSPVLPAAAPAISGTARTVLSSSDRAALNDIKELGWISSFNGKSWMISKGDIVHQANNGEELQMIWRLLNK